MAVMDSLILKIKIILDGQQKVNEHKWQYPIKYFKGSEDWIIMRESPYDNHVIRHIL